MKYIIIILPLLLTLTKMIQAQEKEEATTQQIVESKNYIFKAESANPLRGRVRHLTSDYDLVITGDTVIASLPYFGRAYTAPINPAEGGINFTSSDFDYILDKKKKGRWEILIRPKDVSDTRELQLTIFDNKKASLWVNNTNRESISFNGYIKEGKPKEKKAF
jgi:hypothetical protein